MRHTIQKLKEVDMLQATGKKQNHYKRWYHRLTPLCDSNAALLAQQFIAQAGSSALLTHTKLQKYFYSRIEGACSMRASLTDDNIHCTMGNSSICVAPLDEGFQICLHYRMFFYRMNCIRPLQTVHTYCLSNNNVYKLRCYELGISLPKQLDSVIQSQHHCFWQLPLLLQQMLMPPSSSSHILFVDLILETELPMYLKK